MKQFTRHAALQLLTGATGRDSSRPAHYRRCCSLPVLAQPFAHAIDLPTANRLVRGQQGDHMNTIRATIIAVLLAIPGQALLSPAQCHAADVNWVGYQNGCMADLPTVGSWFHGDNWYNYLVPASGDVAILGSGFDPQDNGYPYTIYFGDFCTWAWPCPGSPVEVPGGSSTIQALRIEDGAWDFIMNSGWYLCGPVLPSTGSLHVLQDIAVGNSDPGGAWLTIANGSVRCDGTVDLGRTVNGSGGLTVSDGASMSVHRLENGDWYGQHGELIVTGEGSAFSIDGPWDTEIGISAGCSGEVTIENDAGMTVENKFWVGRGGAQGDVVIRSGGHLSQINPTSYFWIAGGEGEVMTRGSVTVTDAGSSLTVPNELIVGSSYNESTPSMALLSAGNGALVSSGKIFVGNGLSATGEVHVFGPESRLQAADRLRVGTYGQGALLIEEGASASCHVATIGWAAGSTGSVVLTGAGTSLAVGNQLNVGWNGTGSLLVSDGAEVSCTDFIGVGIEPGGIGTARLTDPDSRLTTPGWLVVGGIGATDGQGMLHVSGGAVAAANLLYVGARGTLIAEGSMEASITNAGLVCPGDSLGRLHVTGGYTQDPGGVLRLEIGDVGGLTHSDTLSAAGPVTLAGQLELSLIDDFAPYPGQRLVIVIADTVSGTFSSVTLEGHYAHVEYGQNSVELVFDGTVGVESIPPAVTVALVNVPNPFNPSTEIRFSLNTPAQTRLGIYDVSGRLIRDLIDEFLAAGMHHIEWDGRDGAGRDVSSGCYFARMESGVHTETTKLILAR